MALIDLLRLDATALALLGHDVAMIPDSALANPTPCEGWTVADLLRHLNERHDAVAKTILPPFDEVSGDPRADFARITARWIVAIEQAGQTVTIPRRGEPLSTERILGVHLVDMLVHRWDLASALRTALIVPTGLTDAALPLARANTAPGSPLNGPGGDYRQPFRRGPGQLGAGHHRRATRPESPMVPARSLTTRHAPSGHAGRGRSERS